MHEATSSLILRSLGVRRYTDYIVRFAVVADLLGSLLSCSLGNAMLSIRPSVIHL